MKKKNKIYSTGKGLFVDEYTLQGGEEFEPSGITKPKLPKKHEHGCDKCEYLGSMMIDELYYDFYTCKQSNYTTYIARYGSNGPEYQSIPDFLLKELEPGYNTTEERALNVMKVEYEIRNSEFKSVKYKFAIIERRTDNLITFLVSPLVEEKIAIYIQNALNRAKPRFEYEILAPRTLASMLHYMEALISKQIDQKI